MDPINPIAGNPEAVNQNPQTPKDNHGITIAALAIFILLALGAIAFLYYQNQQLKTMLTTYQNQPSPTPTVTPAITPEDTASPSAKPKTTPLITPRACTQEAKLCPDGSAVGRTGPNCEFAPCPTP